MYRQHGGRGLNLCRFSLWEVIEMNFLFRYIICRFTKDSRKREEI